jgi:hypothetical protein
MTYTEEAVLERQIVDRRVMRFDAKIHLPLIRDAFDREALQVFNINQGGCSYVGPCALGVCIRPEDRKYYDCIDDIRDEEDELICESCMATDLMKSGLFEFNNEQEAEDFIKLQSLHDAASCYIVNLGLPAYHSAECTSNFLLAFMQFSDHLEHMEAKYL